MSAFIMTGGSLLEIGCPTTLNRATDQDPEFTNTLGGRRVASVRRGGRRSWSISTDVASPLEVSGIEAVARGMRSVGWYGPDAAVGNLLSPQASTFDPVPANATRSGLVQLPDGTIASTVAAAGSVSVGNSSGNYEQVPVRPGVPITVGAWGRGRIGFQGFWYDATGSSITTYLHASVAVAGWGWREVTMTPPVGAVFVSLNIFGGTQYALPSIAWGSTGRAELGTGCPSALVHSPAHDPLVTSRRLNYTNSSYSVTEIG